MITSTTDRTDNDHATKFNQFMKEESKKSQQRKRKRPKLELWETFRACRKQPWGWECYNGNMSRQMDSEDKLISVCGRINLTDEEKIWSKDSSLEKLTRNMEILIELRFDYGMHNSAGVYSHVSETVFYLN